MTDTSAPDDLSTAERFAQRSRRAARRYAGYLLLCAVGTLVLACLIGIAPWPLGAAVGMVVWLVLLVWLTLYQRRQQALLKRFAGLQVIVTMTWASLWIITMVMGSFFFVGDLSWWIPAGIATALPALFGSLLVFRQTH